MKKCEYIYWLFQLFFISFFLISSTCIERNNPWDPMHGCPGDFRQEIQEKSLPLFQKLAENARFNLEQLNRQTSKIDSLNALNDSVHSIFNSVQNKVDSIFLLNGLIDSSNHIDCKMLKNKIKADTLPSLRYFSDTVDMKGFRDSLSNDSIQTIRLILEDNSECRPHGIHSKEFQDSITGFYDSLNRRADFLVESIKHFNRKVTDTNAQIIIQKNNLIAIYNKEVDSYNDSIKIVKEYCKTDWLSDPAEIKKRIDSIQPGDIISIDSGTYKVSLSFSKRGSDEKPIIIQGSPFHTTRLVQSFFSISKCHNIIIRNLSLINSTTRGLTIEDNSSDIWLKHCSITGSNDNGLELLNSSVSIDSCEFLENLDGIHCNGPDAKLELKNVLIARNRVHGIRCNNSELSISKATISDNMSSGIYLSELRNSLSIVSTLLTFNAMYGLALTNDLNEVTFYHSVFFENSAGDFTGDSTKIFIDISCKSGDPRYADRAKNDYTILNSEFSVLGYTP